MNTIVHDKDKVISIKQVKDSQVINEQSKAEQEKQRIPQEKNPSVLSLIMQDFKQFNPNDPYSTQQDVTDDQPSGPKSKPLVFNTPERKLSEIYDDHHEVRSMSSEVKSVNSIKSYSQVLKKERMEKMFERQPMLAKKLITVKDAKKNIIYEQFIDEPQVKPKGQFESMQQ